MAMVVTRLTVVVIWQYIQTSNDNAVHLKCYMSIMLQLKKSLTSLEFLEIEEL